MLVIVLAAWLAAGLAACGGSSRPATSPSPSPAQNGPSAWVQNEASWQASYAGDPQPDSAQWAVTTYSHTTDLLRQTTSGQSWPTAPPDAYGKTKVYVVVMTGAFSGPDQSGPASHARELLILLSFDRYPNYYNYAVYSTQGSFDLSGLGHVHSFPIHAPLTSGVWGRTSWAGGPMVAGGLGPARMGTVAHARVLVYAGDMTRSSLASLASTKVVTSVESDASGFFTLALPPGTYTITARRPGNPFFRPTAVQVEAGKTVAVPLIEDVP